MQALMEGQELTPPPPAPEGAGGRALPVLFGVVAAALLATGWLLPAGPAAGVAWFAAGASAAAAFAMPLGRRHAAAAASAHFARMTAIVDTATEGIVTIDAAGHIETINGAAERLFGHRAADVIGKNVSLLMPSPFREEHD